MASIESSQSQRNKLRKVKRAFTLFLLSNVDKTQIQYRRIRNLGTLFCFTFGKIHSILACLTEAISSFIFTARSKYLIILLLPEYDTRELIFLSFYLPFLKIRAQLYVPTYIPTYLRTYIHTYLRTYIHTYVPTYTGNKTMQRRVRKNCVYGIMQKISVHALCFFRNSQFLEK